MKSRTRATLLMLGIFMLGGIAGSVSVYLYRSQVEASGPRGSRGSRNVVEDLARSLNLDVDQKERLKVIIDQSRDRYRALSLQFRPQYQLIRTETRDAIRQILREDQRVQFEERIKEMDTRQRERRGSDTK